MLTLIFIFKGYIGNVAFLNKLADIVDELRAKNPNMIYCIILFCFFTTILSYFRIYFLVCDPVLGDNGNWVSLYIHVLYLQFIFLTNISIQYVPKELLPIYVERLLPKADIITPNAFELEYILLSLIAILFELEFIKKEFFGIGSFMESH